MEEPNVSQVSSFPLPPMHYVSMYTDENIAKHLAAPPPPPIQGHYNVFGVVHNTEDPIIVPLQAHGIRRLYGPSGQNAQLQPTQVTQIDKKAELKKLNHSILAAYLDVLELLIKSPTNQTERERKLEDLQLLFINFHHLVNEYRPHQALETLKLMLEVQAQERLNIVRRFQRHFDAVLTNFKQCLKDVPDDILSCDVAFEPESAQVTSTNSLKDALSALEQIKPPSHNIERKMDWLMCSLVDDGEMQVGNATGERVQSVNIWSL